MIQTAVEIGMGMVSLSLILCFLRLAAGPTTADRVVAADTLAVNILGLIALFSIRSGESYFILALLALAILSFVGTVVYAKFLERENIIE